MSECKNVCRIESDVKCVACEKLEKSVAIDLDDKNETEESKEAKKQRLLERIKRELD